MKRIAVLSGKGGVGKSSIAGSIAIALKDKLKLVLVDADADCPNLHILFEGKEKSSKVLQASHIAKIDYSKCINCSKCSEVCKFNALEFREKPIVSEFFCEGCGACKVVCPENAISIIPVDTGEAKIIETKNGFSLVYGKLYPGKSGSGKIVYDVRAMADNIAEKEKADLILIDSAAGIGCPVIASITGCDYAIGIVEPTQASIHDLKRALEVVEHFRIPFGVVLNKAGLSKENEEKIWADYENKILVEIPYDPNIPKLLAKKILPIQGEGVVRERLISLAENVGDVGKRRPGVE